MATSTPVLPQTPKHGVVQIANADASNQKTVVTAGSNGAKLVALYASTTDTSARDVQIAIVRSGTTYILGTTTVPANSGNTAGTAMVDLLGSVVFPTGMLATDGDGRKYLFLESGDTLVVLALTTVTSGKIISAHADFANF
jgi:hypothetical protein